MTRDDIIRLAKEAYKDLVTVDYPGHVGQLDPWTLRLLERFAALVAAAEQKPISDVTEAVTKTVIETEKLLCEKIGRQWQPSGMSIRTLVDELATLVAEREREACAMVAEERTTAWTEYDYNSACMDCAKAIRARSEA